MLGEFLYYNKPTIFTSSGWACESLQLKLDALRALTRASYRSTKSYFASSSTRIEYNKHK